MVFLEKNVISRKNTLNQLKMPLNETMKNKASKELIKL